MWGGEDPLFDPTETPHSQGDLGPVTLPQHDHRAFVRTEWGEENTCMPPKWLKGKVGYN